MHPMTKVVCIKYPSKLQKHSHLCSRWLFVCPETSSSSVGASPGPPTSLQSISPRSSASTSSNSCQSPYVEWVNTFMILWDKFLEELMQSLERDKQLSQQMRREMVRIVLCEMMHKSYRVSKRHSTEVAGCKISPIPAGCDRGRCDQARVSLCSQAIAEYGRMWGDLRPQKWEKESIKLMSLTQMKFLQNREQQSRTLTDALTGI